MAPLKLLCSYVNAFIYKCKIRALFNRVEPAKLPYRLRYLADLSMLYSSRNAHHANISVMGLVGYIRLRRISHFEKVDRRETLNGECQDLPQGVLNTKSKHFRELLRGT